MGFRIAIVGLGKIARDQHLPAIALNPSFELSAISSRNAQLSGLPGYSSLADLLDAEPDIDCISLCTPPQARYADARLALEAGRHVMLEKPPGATLSEVEDLAALAERENLSLYTTWHSRHAAAVAVARDWLQDRTLREMRIVWREDVRMWHPGQDWIWEAGGLGVFDPGINALSILTALLSRRVHVADAQLFFPANRDAPIAADLSFFDSEGATITANFDWRESGEPVWDIELLTDKGTARLSNGGAVFAVDGTVRSKGEDREYPGLYARFADLLAQGSSDVDLSPLRHVADAFMLGRRVAVEPFNW